MTAFTEQNARLHCEAVPVDAIAADAGTPLYIYSAATIRDRYRALDAAFAGWPRVLHYALKANSLLAIVRLMRELGSGVDANSGGEIEVALRAGFEPDRIVFTGVGKRRDELERAVALGVKAINAESAGELDRIDRIATARGTRAHVALRVNPDIDAGSHPHITTGLRGSSFGVAVDEAIRISRTATGRTGVDLTGLHLHIGSQITSIAPLRRAARAAVEISAAMRQAGAPLEHIDLGGGLGVSYDGTPVPSPQDYADAIVPAIRETGLALLLEPGRTIVAPAGALIARVVDTKDQPGGSRFVVLDGGMTELLRPALYGAFHRIVSVVRRPGPEVVCDVVGPLCESSDVLGRDRLLPVLEVGDLVAVLDTGAYGAVMASNYNRRPMPAEVLVDGGDWRVVRRRQTIDDLLAGES